MPKFLEKVPVRLSGGVSQQSISEGSDGNTQLADHVFPSGPEVFTGMTTCVILPEMGRDPSNIWAARDGFVDKGISCCSTIYHSFTNYAF